MPADAPLARLIVHVGKETDLGGVIEIWQIVQVQVLALYPLELPVRKFGDASVATEDLAHQRIHLPVDLDDNVP